MNSEPGAAVLSIFDQLVDRIKQQSPVRSDGKPTGTKVYSHLLLGMPVWKDDYFRPWTPAGGASLRDTFPQAAGGPAAGAPAAGGAAAGAAAAPSPDPRLLQAMQAAWKTSLLCRTMLRVTNDDRYDEYPIGRHLDFAYETVLKGMQPSDPPQMAPDVKARLDEAQKVLYILDTDGSIIGNTPVYTRYLNNTMALAKAKADLAAQFALAQRDPAKFEVWPVQSQPFQAAVDMARNNLLSQGAEKVERALDIMGSIGLPMQAHMIKKARDAYDNWNLGLSGSVPGDMPFSMILPTNWCDPDDHQGFETLIVDDAEIQHFASQSGVSQSAQSWASHAESTGGGGAVSFGFVVVGGSHGSSSTSSSFQDSSSSQFQSGFRNTAKGLHIELEYGLCTIVRPWLVSDLFFLRNWFCAGIKKNTISDGTIDGQVDPKSTQVLPMIPQQFLVVRNVSISATDWGDDGEVLNSFYGADQGSADSSASKTSGGAGVCLGFVNFGGTASHSEADAHGQSSSFAARSSSDHFGSTFDGQTLRMPGTQIVAFLSDIVPACPDQDDPTLK